MFGCQGKSSPAGPDAGPVVSKKKTAPTPDKPAEDKWLSVSYGVDEIAIVELRREMPTKLILQADNDQTRELDTVWKTAIAKKAGIALDVSVPDEHGGGLGHGTQIFPPGQPGYAMAVESEIEEAEFEVRAVPVLENDNPSKTITELRVSRSGEKLGHLAFAGAKPKLHISTKDVDGRFLKSHWERIEKRPEAKVNYVDRKGNGAKLVTRKAKPGDADYADVVRLYLILYHPYQVEIVP